MKRTTPSLGFKSILRRHRYHPDGLPLYNNMSKQWLVRDGERWWHLDAAGEQLPRVAKIAAHFMTGQHRPDFTPGMLAGDQIVITNVKDVVMVGDDWARVPITWNTKYPGGKYRVRLTEMYDRDPCMLLWWYIRQEINHHFRFKLKTRMAPMEKAWMYEGAVHPHGDKSPRPLNWTDPNPRREAYRGPMHQTRWSSNQFLQ